MSGVQRRGQRRRSTAALVVALATTALALAGCVSLPTSGPVTTITQPDSDVAAGPIDIDPLGPQHDATPDEIVSGFLDAMQQTPISTTVAREFLAPAAGRSWQPSARTITYASHTVPQGGSTVTTSLTGADQLDARGAWKGAIDAGMDDYQLTFSMIQQRGQWRITNPPDALIVPESWFQERFQQVSLYFFDPTGTVLVPDPVFVPTGRQLASSLISGLLAGPPADLADSALDLVPAGLRVAVSVPVSRGVADVQLTGDSAADVMPSSDQAGLMVAQLALTLSQDSEIKQLRVSIGGQPVQVDGQNQFPIGFGDRYAPYVAASSTLLYGLSGGRMVSGSAQNLDPVAGAFGAGDYLLRDAVPDLLADRAAGVGAAGTSLLVGSIRSGGGPVSTVLTGAEDLLTPAWDFSGRLWEVDRRRTGAVVYHVEQDGTVGTLSVPGITGEDVKAFLISRDGSRIIAVVHRAPGQDQLVVGRILADAQGRVVRAIDERVVTEEAAPSTLPIRAIAWRSPTSIVVLHPVGPALYQVRTATVDGAPSGAEALTLTLTGSFTGLAGTPSPDESVYATGPGRLVDLSGSRAGSIDIDPDVTALTYPG